MNEVQTPHRRVTEQLLEYWTSIKGDKKYPSLGDVDEKKLAKIWNDSFVVEVFPLVFGYGHRFLHKGKNLSEEFTYDISGHFIKNTIIDFLENSNDQYVKIIESGEIIHTEKVFDIKGHAVKFRQILLPLGDEESGVVDAVLGAMRFVAIDANKNPPQ